MKQWELLKAYLESMRKSPLRLLVVIVLAIIIFSLLVAMVFLLSPKDRFRVECLQVNGKDGNLFVVDSDEQYVTFNVILNVRDCDNMSVDKARVTLSGGDSKAKGVTDEDGLVAVSLDAIIPIGDYMTPFKVKVEKNGFNTYVENNFVIVARV